MRPKLTVVIPAYNESNNFRNGVLEPAVEYLRKQKYSYEVIFVDDGSTDDSKMLLEDFCKKNRGFRVMTIAHGGKVAAVTAGVLAAKGEVVLFTDFDQQTKLSQVAMFLAAHGKGFDVAIGSRGGKKKTGGDTWWRKLRGWVWVKIVQAILWLPIRDTQCGFKSFSRQVANRLFRALRVTNLTKAKGGYMGAWDVEVLFLAQKFGYRIAQIPVSWVKIEGDRLNPWKEPLMMIADAIKIRLWDMAGRYHNL